MWFKELMRFPIFLLCVVAALLTGCYDWSASDRPISGLKLEASSGIIIPPGVTLVYSGSIVANSIDSVRYGVAYKPLPFEYYQDSARATAPFDTAIGVKVEQQSVGSLRYLLPVPNATLPGQYAFFTYARDGDGNKSDSNLVYGTILDRSLYPAVNSTNPSFTNQALNQSRSDSVSLAFTATDSLGLLSIQTQLCPANVSRNTFCVTQRTLTFPDDSVILSYRDTLKVELPVGAQPSEQYRARILITNRRQNQYGWQPLYRIVR